MAVRLPRFSSLGACRSNQWHAHIHDTRARLASHGNNREWSTGGSTVVNQNFIRCVRVLCVAFDRSSPAMRLNALAFAVLASPFSLPPSHQPTHHTTTLSSTSPPEPQHQADPRPAEQEGRAVVAQAAGCGAADGHAHVPYPRAGVCVCVCVRFSNMGACIAELNAEVGGVYASIQPKL
jgi:hypothetical protein